MAPGFSIFGTPPVTFLSFELETSYWKLKLPRTRFTRIGGRNDFFRPGSARTGRGSKNGGAQTAGTFQKLPETISD